MLIWADYAILGLIGISATIGLIRGFVREVFSLITWLLAVWIGLSFSRELSAYFQTLISVPSLRMAVSFLILFFLTLIVGSLVTYLLTQLIKAGLSGSDRFAGMIFGILRGVLVICVLVLLAGLTPLPQDPWWAESTLIEPFESLAVWLRNQLPAGVAGYVSYQ